MDPKQMFFFIVNEYILKSMFSKQNSSVLADPRFTCRSDWFDYFAFFSFV